MHGNTFKVLKSDQIVTVWADGEFKGRCGKVASIIGELITVGFSDGSECQAKYNQVAVGDNSRK